MTDDELRRAYDRVAGEYGRRFVDELAAKPLDRALYAAFAELVRGRGTVLEVGCGPAQVGRYLHDQGVDVLATDLAPEMVEVARALHPGLACRVEDLLAVRAPDAAFVGLVAAYAIVHLAPDDVSRAAREWARLVTPGGWLLCAFHVEEDAATVHLDEFLGERVSLDFRFHRVDAVERALDTAGFAVDARLERRGHEAIEHPSLRAYLLARRG